MFEIDLNLDDPAELEGFINKHSTLKGRTLANRLGFSGKGAATAATALSNYAWNKHTAVCLREKGDITKALGYEEICDRIYREDIEPNIKCW